MKVAVVGAGVGGLAAAIELAAAGHEVTVFERAAAPGGKCARVERGGFAWDAGPVAADDAVGLRRPRARPAARRARHPLRVRRRQRARAVRRPAACAGGAGGLVAGLRRGLDALPRHLCASMWRASERFLTGPPPFPPRRPEPGEPMPDPRDALRVKPWWTLRAARARARRATRGCGWSSSASRPTRAPTRGARRRRSPSPGYVEHAFGAWHPRGGMYELVLAMVRRLEALGGELRLSTPVERIGVAHGRVWGVETAAGAFTADAVVTDVDERVVRTRLLGRPARRRTPSLSGLALLLGVRDDAASRITGSLFPRRLRRRVRRHLRRTAGCRATRRCTSARRPGQRLVRARQRARVARRLGREPTTPLVRDRLERARRASSSASPPPTSAARSTAARRTAAWRAMRRPGNRIRGVEGLWLTGGTVHPGRRPAARDARRPQRRPSSSAGHARPTSPRRHRARNARTAPPSTTAPPACAGRPRVRRRAVRVRLDGVAGRARARTSPGAARAPRRSRRTRAGPASRAAPAPAPGDGAMEGEQAPRPDRRAGEDRDRPALALDGRGSRERIHAAPGAVRAHRREPHRVALGGPPARGDRRRGEEGVERGVVVPDREQRPAPEVGRQRHRVAAPRSEQAQEPQAAVRAQRPAGPRPCTGSAVADCRG